MILPDDTTPFPPEDEIPPFASDPACPSCQTPWPNHPGIAKVCHDHQIALIALKAAAVQAHMISQTLQKIVARIETPQSPTSTIPQISDLLDDMDL